MSCCFRCSQAADYRILLIANYLIIPGSQGTVFLNKFYLKKGMQQYCPSWLNHLFKTLLRLPLMSKEIYTSTPKSQIFLGAGIPFFRVYLD